MTSVLLALCGLIVGALSNPIYRNECKDPSLNDCPVDSSTCFDLAFEYTCQCKSGFVDQSPDIKKRPGRVCVPADSVAAKPPVIPAAPKPDDASSDKSDLPSGDSLKEPEPKDAQGTLDERARDDGNDTKTGRTLANGGDDLKNQFKEIDANKNGKVDITELRTALKSIGSNFREEQVKRMLKAADTNGDGSVTYDEFQALIKEETDKKHKKH